VHYVRAVWPIDPLRNSYRNVTSEMNRHFPCMCGCDVQTKTRFGGVPVISHCNMVNFGQLTDIKFITGRNIRLQASRTASGYFLGQNECGFRGFMEILLFMNTYCRIILFRFCVQLSNWNVYSLLK
jgi:hypothetical protein